MMALRGFRNHINHLRRLASPEAARIAGAIVEEGADTIRAEAHRLIMAGSSSGQRGGKHQHVPSRPGEPPNNEFGDLIAGIKSEKTGTLTARVVSTAPHAKALEFGTSKMAARPYLRVARDIKVEQIRRRFAEQMAAFIKRSR